jgi:pimeloyl-ACP methyl ester carboxylesterase
MNSEFQVQRFKTIDGIFIVGDVGGTPGNPAVILAHGGGQTRHSWGTAMRQLVARGYHVINLDARGHGESDWSPNSNYSMDLMAEDLRGVIRTLSVRPAIVGASMGGIAGLNAVGESSESLATALVLVDVVPRVTPAGAAKIVGFMKAHPDGFATLEEAAKAVAAYNPHRPPPDNASGLMKNLRLRSDGRLYWHWDPKLLTNPYRLEPPQFAARLLASARGVKIPTLLVRGLQSDIVSDAGIQELRENLPQLELFDVSGAGHMVAGDRNDIFNAGVVRFLERYRPVSGQ